MILILSALDDDHVPLVLNRLRLRGADVVWFDPAQFPSQCSLSVEFDARGPFRKRLQLQDRTIDLDHITAVWLRRPNAVTADASVVNPDLRKWIGEIAATGLQGALGLLDCLWVPARPQLTRDASDKLGQLKVASKLGLKVPRTLVTNSPDAFVVFYSDRDTDIVAKTLGDAMFVGPDGDPLLTYTTVVRRRHALNAQSVRHAPTIFQAYVPKKLELRVTIVGDRVFAAAIDSQRSRMTKDDWRHYDDELDSVYAPHSLPADIEKKLRELLREYGLAFGAIDMVLTPEGEYVFLELNPNGQWGWIADLAGWPIDEAIADLLLMGRAAAGTYNVRAF